MTKNDKVNEEINYKTKGKIYVIAVIVINIYLNIFLI